MASVAIKHLEYSHRLGMNLLLPGHCYIFRREISSNGGSFQRLRNFFKSEKKVVDDLNKLSMPYANLWDLAENLHSRGERRNPKSFLMKSSYLGHIHRPSIPMKSIKANIKMYEENLSKRKLSGIEMDLKNDIIEPFDRLNKIEEEKLRYSAKKEVLTKSMKIFWENKESSSQQDIPLEMVQKRKEAIKISCILSLLSWMYHELEGTFYDNALLLPNLTHPNSPVGEESCANIVKLVNKKPPTNIHGLSHMDAGEVTSVIRQSNIVNFSGLRTYYLFKEAAELEQALVRYALDILNDHGFHFMSGPNILHASAFEGSGIPSNKLPDMLYHIDEAQEKDFYLAGTSEVGIAAFFANHAIPLKHLPLKICCVSTCNRKETSSGLEPKGIYRVHHFTKVEMFGITANETGQESENMFQEFLDIQEKIFSNLGLHFRILDMPTQELGLPAYQKVDMEAWMSQRESYGEISSTSNCTDYQSRRLHILYKNGNEYEFAHTLNGTACAIPRVLISLLENNQKGKTIFLPEVLHKYMKRLEIDRSSRLPMEYIGPNQSKRKQKIPVD